MYTTSFVGFGEMLNVSITGFSVANRLEYASIPEYDLIILNELTSVSSGMASALFKYVQEGGKVLFFPASRGSLEQYNALLRTMGATEFQAYTEQERVVGKINTDAFIFRDVFNRTRPNMRLPKVKASFPQAGSGSRGQSLLEFRDGSDFITFYTPGKGAFAVVHAPLDQSVNDLSLQPEVFVPLLYKMAIYTSDVQKLAHTIGADQLIAIDKEDIPVDKEFMIRGASEFIPGISPLGSKILLDVQGQIRESGFYQVSVDNQLVASVAFNYDRRESDLAITDIEELPKSDHVTIWTDDVNTDFAHLIQVTQQGKQLWKWCIILGLFFIACEIALIRLWKNA